MYSPREHWNNLAERYENADSEAFAPVLHPGTPPWFNQLIDKQQFRAVRRALVLAGVSPGDHVLDIGCGTGRWARRYKEFGLRVTGIDATAGMLTIARRQGTAGPLVVGLAHRLPFPSATFDCVSDITVVQHIPLAEQGQALREAIRVLKPGGRMIFMELIRGEGPHIFPRRPEGWIQEFAAYGARLIGWFGQEYLVLDRLFVGAALAAAGRNGRSAGGSVPAPLAAPNPSRSRRAYWAIRRITASISAWADPIAERILPAHFAIHGVFVLLK